MLTAAHWIESDAGTVASVVDEDVAALVVAAAMVVIVGCVADGCVVGACVANVVGTTVGPGTVAGSDGTMPGKVVATVAGVRVELLVLVAATTSLFGTGGSVAEVCTVITVGAIVDVDAIGAIGVATVVVSWLAGTTITPPLRIAGNAAATEAAANDATATAAAIPARRLRRIGTGANVSTKASSPKTRRSSASRNALDGAGTGRIASRSSAERN